MPIEWTFWKSVRFMRVSCWAVYSTVYLCASILYCFNNPNFAGSLVFIVSPPSLFKIVLVLQDVFPFHLNLVSGIGPRAFHTRKYCITELHLKPYFCIDLRIDYHFLGNNFLNGFFLFFDFFLICKLLRIVLKFFLCLLSKNIRCPSGLLY